MTRWAAQPGSGCSARAATAPQFAEVLFDVINLNRPPETMMTDEKFMAAVREIMQRPEMPADDPDAITPYPPEVIAD